MQDLAFQFIFNPNFQFRGNQNIEPGNDYMGIWAPNIEILGPFPKGYAHLGSLIKNIDHPGTFNPEGYDYGFRVKTVIQNAILTFLFFYGRDRDYVTQNVAAPPFVEMSQIRRKTGDLSTGGGLLSPV